MFVIKVYLIINSSGQQTITKYGSLLDSGGFWCGGVYSRQAVLTSAKTGKTDRGI